MKDCKSILCALRTQLLWLTFSALLLSVFAMTVVSD
jgi:hypothetical protein